MESVGFTRQQAERMAEEQAKLIDDRLATKEDIDVVNANIATEVERLNANIAAEVERLNANIVTTAERTKAEILKWVLGTGLAQTVVLLAAMVGIMRLGAH